MTDAPHQQTALSSTGMSCATCVSTIESSLEIVDAIRGDGGVIEGGYRETKREVLRLAAAERESEHSIGQAIIEHAENQGIELAELREFESVPAKGIEAVSDDQTVSVGNVTFFEQVDIDIPPFYEETWNEREQEGKTTVLVGVEEEIGGVVSTADTIKEGSKDAIETLHDRGLKSIGDHELCQTQQPRTVGDHTNIPNKM